MVKALDVSVSWISGIRVWVARRSVGSLLLIWLMAYVVLGLIFAVAYRLEPGCGIRLAGHDCQNSFWTLVYFSFTTQSTLGYGDYVPEGMGRATSAVQGVVGLAINALLLGVVVFKSLKRSNPLIFSRFVVYELAKHRFWFRFVNCDADNLRDVEVRVQLASPGTPRSDYDTQSNEVPIKPKFFVVPKLRLFAFRTESNEGKIVNLPGDDIPVVLAPGHLSGDKAKRLEITVKGYFESTGDVFYYSKQYTPEEIRCGAFDDVDNNALEGKPDSDKEAAISEKLDRIISTSADKCVECPHHKGCQLDIAVKTRARQD